MSSLWIMTRQWDRYGCHNRRAGRCNAGNSDGLRPFQVLETLSKHHILSAPLVVRPDGSTQSLDTERLLVKALVGFVSVEDFLTAFLAGR